MRLLLAEDEIELSRALTTILQRNGFSVDTVYNGVDALEYLEGGTYDGAILDIMMPGMNGLLVLKEIRRQSNSIPVLLLSAKSEIDDRVAGLDAGADDYLTKPFAAKELLARVRAMLRRKTITVEPALTFGNITLDRSTFMLSSPHGEVRLGNREFQLLEMLMIRPGHVISTDHFMEQIWGYDCASDNNVVWVYLSYLRKKMRSIGFDVRIRATRSLGYCLEKIA